MTTFVPEMEKMEHDPGSATGSVDPLKVYLDDIGKIPLLTSDETQQLAYQRRAGVIAQKFLDESAENPSILTDGITPEGLGILIDEGHVAHDHLVTANLRLVVSVARRYQNKGVALLDLIQEGNTGLIRGVERFDPDKGFQFSTYVKWWIRQAVKVSLPSGSAIKIPEYWLDDVYTVKEARKRLLSDGKSNPTQQELQDASGLNNKRFGRAVSAHNYQAPQSLDQQVAVPDGSAGREFHEFVPNNAVGPEDLIVGMFDHLERVDAFKNALHSLTDRQRDVLLGLYGQGMTMQELGAEWGVTRETLMRDLRAAKKELTKILGSSSLYETVEPSYAA